MSFLLPIQLFKILADETRLGIVLLLSVRIFMKGDHSITSIEIG